MAKKNSGISIDKLSTSRLFETPLSGIRGIKVNHELPIFNEFVAEFEQADAGSTSSFPPQWNRTWFILSSYYPSLRNQLLIAVTEVKIRINLIAISKLQKNFKIKD